MNIIKNCKECELTPESCNCVCLDLAAAPSPSVPAVESRPPVPALITGLVFNPESFDPFSTFASFVDLIQLVRGNQLSYRNVITRIYDIDGDFLNVTVAQLITAIYAAAEDQSK